MSFDIAVGMSGDQLNAALAAVYDEVYPDLFTGSYQVEYAGLMFTVGIDVKEPPKFDLRPIAPAPALARELTARIEAEPGAEAEPQGGPAGERGPGKDEIIAAVAEAYPSFTVVLPASALTFSNGVTSTLTLTLTAYCYLENGPGPISFVPYSVTAPEQLDPVNNYFVQDIVLPHIKTMLTQVLAGVTIPPIEVANVPLSPPSIGIADDYVIAAANLASSGTPPPPDGSFPWPSTPFFALLGPNLIQQLGVLAASSATNNFSDSGGGGDYWGGYDWEYGLSLTDPSPTIQDNDVEFAFTLRGTVSAGVHVAILSIDLGFNAYAEPDPRANISLSIDADQLVLVAQSVAPFTIFVTPNTVPTWVFGWLITAIVNCVTVSLTPLITEFLKNIRLDSYAIPTYSVSVAGKNLRLTPVNLSVGNAGGMIGVAGNVTITSG
jgi:hypothetical protein